jgi:hypothetical protein
MRKEMEGDNKERRRHAKQARAAGKAPSAVGATEGSSKQRTKARRKLTHQQRIDLKREGKQDVIGENTPKARPGSRDRETPDHERYPRL